MKKQQLVIISLCVAYIFGLLLISTGGIFSKTAIATSDTIFSSNYVSINDLEDEPNMVQTLSSSGERLNFPNQYFRNLENHGINTNGSCAYVAIGMFLSYYDTYWNDRIIPEAYDKQGRIDNTEYNGYKQSPGIFDQRSYYANDREYKAHMYTQLSNNLHAYLLSIGDSLGYVGSGTDGSFGLTVGRINNVLNRYLQLHPAADSNNFYYTFVDHSYDYQTYSASMLQDIKTYVKLGQIVIVAISGRDTRSYDRVGHAIVAYDYDEDTDTLYGHFGWNSLYNHTNVLGRANVYDFQHIVGYIVASPYESDHIHSDNYELPSGQKLCSCQLSSHEHRYRYEKSTASQHRRYCYCGYSSYEAHVFSGSSGRYVFCQQCNYRKLNDGGIIEIPNPFSKPEILEAIENFNKNSQQILPA